MMQKVLSRSGIPDEMNVVPLGPCLSPGAWDECAEEKLREKLLVLGFVAAIVELMFYKFEQIIPEKLALWFIQVNEDPESCN